jgi:hypothetical protein
MQWFYDGQIRRYLTQTIRVFSNFVVKYGDGTLVRIPVMYGDADRQVASIMRNNSENKINSVPRMSVYVSGLTPDASRLSDSTYVGKLHFRERGIDNTTGDYTNGQGRNYTVERLMPTPYKLTMKLDIWSANTDQKLQILEQILVLFNPTLELQTTDNYIDWTSISTLNINDINWSSRTVPVGNDTPIEVATLTLETPIWLSPPVKVKHLGVITKIVTGLWGSKGTNETGYIDGLGADLAGTGDYTFSDQLASVVTTITDYSLQVYNGQAVVLGATENVVPREPTLDIPTRMGTPIDWNDVFNRYPGTYTAGSSRLYLTQPNGSYVVGTVAINPTDSTLLAVSWDPDTLTTNTGIDSTAKLDVDPGYSAAGSYRPNSPGTFDAIINPLTFNPGTVVAGTRYLIIDDIGSSVNLKDSQWTGTPGTAAANYSLTWGPLVAPANSIIEYTGTGWNTIFNAAQETTVMVWQTNIYTGVQYKWDGVSWSKSFEGEYEPGSWRLEL